MHPLTEDIIRLKYMEKVVRIREDPQRSHIQKKKEIQEIAHQLNAELLDVEANGEEVLMVHKAFKEDIGKGVVVISSNLAEELGMFDGCPVLVKHRGHAIERNIKPCPKPGFNYVFILMDRDDRTRLGVKVGDMVRLSIPMPSDPGSPEDAEDEQETKTQV